MIACNQVTLIGEVLSDNFNFVHLANGGSCFSFDFLTKENWYNKKTGSDFEHKETHRVALRDIGSYKMASRYKEIIKPDMRLLINGKLRYKSYTDENNNKQRYVEIDCTGIEVLAKSEKTDQFTVNKNQSFFNKLKRNDFNVEGVDFS